MFIKDGKSAVCLNPTKYGIEIAYKRKVLLKIYKSMKIPILTYTAKT